ARTDQVALDDVNADEVGEDHKRQHPTLKESDDHTERPGDENAQHGDELHEEGDDAEQQRVPHAEHAHAKEDQQADEQGHDERAANVAPDDLVEDGDQHVGAAPLRRRSLLAQPSHHAGSVGDQVGAENEDEHGVDDGVQDRPHEVKGVGGHL